MKKFISIIENYEKKLTEDAGSELPANPAPAIPQAGPAAPTVGTGQADAPEDINVPESVVTLVRLLKKALIMDLSPEDVATVTKLPEVNENNSNQIMGQLVSLMRQYSADIPIDANTDTES